MWCIKMTIKDPSIERSDADSYLYLIWRFHWTEFVPPDRTAEGSWTPWDSPQSWRAPSSKCTRFHCLCRHLKKKYTSLRKSVLKLLKHYTPQSVWTILFSLLVNAYVPLTASEPERTGVAVHRKVYQPHRAVCADCQPDSKRTHRNTSDASFPVKKK